MNGSFDVYHTNRKFLTISSINFNFNRPLSIAVVHNSASLLSLDCIYPSSAQFRTETGDVNATINITFENNSLRFQSAPGWASNTTIVLKDNGEHFYGLLEPLYPDNRKSPDLRGEVIDIDIVGNSSRYHENYATAYSAFYMTNQGYASFFDSFASGKYRLGIKGETELCHFTNRLDWYIIKEKSSDDILKTYYSIIGKPKFVPMWACGPIGWRDENKGGKMRSWMTYKKCQI